MVERLYRGKRIDNGEWVVGIPWIFAPPVNKAVIVYAMGLVGEDDDTSRYCECHEVDPSTIGQYTGLTDKNGKKIFEGDIVREDDVVRNGKIQIEGQAGRVSFVKCCYIIEFGESWDFLATNAKSVKVIGNIHDNPELLGG